MSALFEGEVLVGRLDRIEVGQIVARAVVVRDPSGAVVLEIDRLRVVAQSVELARRALLGTGRQTLVIDHVRADEVRCAVRTDAVTGLPSIALAFRPVPRSRPVSQTPTDREIRVWVGHIEIGRGAAHGEFPGLGRVDADVAHVRGSVLATAKGAAIDVERFGAVIRGLGGRDARGTGELHVRAPGRMWSSFDGFVGDVGVAAWAQLRGKVLEAHLELPRAEPARVREVWSPWPFLEDARVRVDAEGELPTLATALQIDLGAARLRAEGHARLAGDVGVRADLEAQHFDLRSLVPTSPQTDIGASAQLILFEGDEGLTVRVNGITTPATAGAVDVPATDLNGSLVGGEFTGRATLHERGIPIKVDLDVTRDGAVKLKARARSFRLQRSPRVAALTPADGVASVDLTGKIMASELDATVDGTIEGFSLADVSARRARVVGTVRGPLTDPAALKLDLRVDAQGVSAASASFERVDVGVRGAARAPMVTARLEDPKGPSFELEGVVEPLAGRANGVRVAVLRDGTRVEGSVKKVSLAPGAVVIEGLLLRGAGGELALDVAVDARHARVRSRGGGVELAEVARVLGLPAGMISGRVAAVDVDVELDARKTRPSSGRVSLRLEEVTALGLERFGVATNASLADGQLDGRCVVTVPALGEATLLVRGEVAGAALDPEAWWNAVGDAELRLANIDLAEVSSWMAPSLGDTTMAGRASGALRISRPDADALPNVQLAASTEGLAVHRPEADYRGVDLGALGQIDGAAGHVALSASAGATDGNLASARAALDVDLEQLIREPDRVMDILLAARAQGTIRVPTRDLTRLPEFVPPLGLQGGADARVDVTGTLGDPVISLSVAGRQVSAPEARFREPLDGTASITVRPRTGDVGANAELRYAGARVVYLTGEGNAPLESAIAIGPAALAEWTGKATAQLYDVPLGVIPFFDDLGIHGAARGVVTAERTAGDPQLRAAIDVRQLAIHGVPLGGATVRLEPTSDRVDLHVSLDEGARFDAAVVDARRPPLAVGVRAGLMWTDGVPALDLDEPVQIQAQAEALDARALMPAARVLVTELSGRVDGILQLTMHAEPPPGVAAPQSGADPAIGSPERGSVASSSPASPAADRQWRTEVAGAVGLQGGVVQLVGLGLEIADVSLDARATVHGSETVIHVTDFTGRARSDLPNVRGWAELHLDRDGLAGGKGALSASEMPLPIGGVSLASVTGQASFQLERGDPGMEATVALERMVARLPLSATRSLLDVAEHPGIRVAQPLRQETASHAGEATPWHVVFDLGHQARVVRSDFEIPVTGRPELHVAEATTLSGYVDLEPGGRLPLLGKTFRVESGRVWLDPEDSANPRLNVVASWRAPQATVYLRVQGRWESPQLRLESDPPYSEDEIFVLLLGGSLDDARASQEGTQMQAAYGAAQALGMGQLFAGTPLSEVEVSPDTNEGATRYRASYRLSDRVRLEGIYQPESRTTATDTASSASGTLDESRRRDSFAAAMELGLGRGWFLRTEAGNASAEADVLWQYRY